MKWTNTMYGLYCGSVLLIAALGPGGASAQDAGTLIADSLNGPMGILVTPAGDVLVVDSGTGGEHESLTLHPVTRQPATVYTGETSRILKLSPDGSQTTLQMLPSALFDPQNVYGGARLVMVDDDLYVTSGAWSEHDPGELPPFAAAVVRIRDGKRTEVASLWPLERDENPDETLNVESNPFGMTLGPDGHLWVADAAANTLVRIDPNSGSLELVAVFEGVESPLPRESRGGARETDPVPTAVAFDDDGNALVSLLPGLPLLPGTGQVVKVTPEGQVSGYATNLTMPTDLRRGPDGALYAVSFARFTDQGPEPNSGAIVRIREGAESEVVLEGLSFPTSIDFNDAGDAFVTLNGVGEPGSGEVRKFEALAAGG